MSCDQDCERYTAIMVWEEKQKQRILIFNYIMQWSTAKE